MKYIITFFFLSLAGNGWTQTGSYSQQMATTVMQLWKDSFALDGKPAKWTYDMGVILKGFENLWLCTGRVIYFQYIQKQMDFFVKEDGRIATYKPDEYNLDHLNNGKLLMTLYRVTGKEKYLKAARLLREQLQTQPRTSGGSFWHKKIYPNQVWLDGLYMSLPFYAEYAMLMHEDTAFSDIASQFIRIEQKARDLSTGLLYHAWDESRQMKWADPYTGLSKHFWSRAMGWYASALVDVLDYFPASHPGRKSLIEILNRLVTAIGKQQDKSTGLWYDVMNYKGPGKEKNYFEASASSQFVYTIAKAVRKGYIPAAAISIARTGYDGILKKFVKTENGKLNLHGTVKVSGLGGQPFRDGSFAYYMSEPVIVNDPKGIGAFLLASTEMEMQVTRPTGIGKTILLDRYFNSEKRKDITGKDGYWHYVWEERSNAGFSFLGSVFERYGAKLASLDSSPTAQDLKQAAVFILVDPDHTKDNPAPHFLAEKDIQIIQKWVRAGGVLMLMANDSANCELEHFNKLAGVFGFHFTNKSLHMVKNDTFEQGAVLTGENHAIFKTAKKIFLKEISTLELHGPATALLRKQEDIIMTAARYGRGTVFAVGDPWLYNEYVDGRKLPAEYENFKAAEDLVGWILQKTRRVQ